MKQCKYIMLDDNIPILFHCGLTHHYMAEGRVKRVTSAGFVSVHGGPEETIFVSVYGKSVSLNSAPAKDDAYWIEKMLTE